jgi:cytochrome c peroxidase
LSWIASPALAAGAAPGGMSRAAVYAQVRAMSALGRRLFSEPALSGSGTMSCASCHSPQHFFGPPNDLPVQLGGPDMQQPGRRAVPSLMYLQVVPQFTEHFFDNDEEGDESVDNGPTGGLTWDGRADSAHDQARIPLLSPYEMANSGPAQVVASVRKAGYEDDFRAIFGADLFKDQGKAFAAILKVLEVYQQEPEFYPYSSKYDAYLAGKATLTPQEARGLAAFNDPAKGNCAECHLSERAGDGTPPQFTDYGLIALGAPRNRAIPVNADPDYFDLGLCGPERTDMPNPDYCGRFMTPTLRNVATRKVFFHNGVFHTLRQVLEFYAERDTNPGKFYPRKPDGTVNKYDDLPARYWPNIETEAPFGQKPGDTPRISSGDIDDIIAFLGTLTDGYGEGKEAALTRAAAPPSP